jgi:hypothetical protein
MFFAEDLVGYSHARAVDKAFFEEEFIRKQQVSGRRSRRYIIILAIWSA